MNWGVGGTSGNNLRSKGHNPSKDEQKLQLQRDLDAKLGTELCSHHGQTLADEGSIGVGPDLASRTLV